MVDNSYTDEPTQPLKQLQEHLTKQGETHQEIGVKLRSGQAEKLICDLEAVAPCQTNALDAERLTISAMTAEEERLANQARTQVMHEEPPTARKSGAQTRHQRHPVQERVVIFDDDKTHSIIENKSQNKHQRTYAINNQHQSKFNNRLQSKFNNRQQSECNIRKQSPINRRQHSQP